MCMYCTKVLSLPTSHYYITSMNTVTLLLLLLFFLLKFVVLSVISSVCHLFRTQADESQSEEG